MMVRVLHMLLMVYHRMHGPVRRHVICAEEVGGSHPLLLLLVLLYSLHIVETLLGVDLSIKHTVADGAETGAARIIWKKKTKTN